MPLRPNLRARDLRSFDPRIVLAPRHTRVVTAVLAALLLTLPVVVDPGAASLGAQLTAQAHAQAAARAATATQHRPAALRPPTSAAARRSHADAAAEDALAGRVTAAAPKAVKAPPRKSRKAAPRTPARKSPRSRPATYGHYLRSLVGDGRDYGRMRALGAWDAAHNGSGQHVVLLDIGGQTPHGVFLSTTHKFIGYGALARAMAFYVLGYQSRQPANASAIIAIGTNNDLFVNAGAGAVWATQVVNPVRAAARNYARITVAGADDIEPGFRASPAATRAWLMGYLRNTSAPFVFNGSADGCSTRHWPSRCNSGWTSNDIVGLAGGIAPNRTFALPQIYNGEMAGQWGMLARSALRTHHGPLRILGPLTENVACGGDPYCPTMSSSRAANLLWYRLRRAGMRVPAVPIKVDLDVH